MMRRLLYFVVVCFLFPVSAFAQSAETFRDVRRQIDQDAKEGKWQKVRHNVVKPDGRKIDVLGYVEAYVIQKLVYVDSIDKENRSITLYYFQDGVLISVYELREGSYTETDGYAEAEETYNFSGQKLLQWHRVPGGWVDSSDAFFQMTGKDIQKDAIERGQLIYDKIQAD